MKETATQPDRNEIEETLREFFAPKDRDVAAVYLFGSTAREETRGTSDVDVAVLFRADPPKTLDGLHLNWAGELGEELGRDVDLIVLNFADADLAHNVRLDGRVVVDHDSEARIAHEVRSRNEYFDLQPYLRRYRYPEALQ